MNHKIAKRGGTSNTPSPNSIKVISRGIDSLYVGFYCNLDKSLYELLEEKKQKAQDHKEKKEFTDDLNNNLTIENVFFNIRPHGYKNYSYIIFNDLFDILITKKTIKPYFPNVYVKFKSLYLWSLGYKKAFYEIEDFIYKINEDESARNVVSRIDICADFINWRPKLLDYNNFIKRAVHSSAIHKEDFSESYYKGKKLTGFTFGKKNIVCRLYNKSEEIKNSNKQWFYDMWGEEYNDKEVWRLEFQLRRDALKRFDLNTVEETYEKLDNIWAYLTQKWISLRVPNYKEEKVTRWNIKKEWIILSNIIFESKAEPLIINKFKEHKIERIIPTLIGYLTSYAAHKDLYNLSEIFKGLNSDIIIYLDNKKLKLDSLIKLKNKIFNIAIYS